MKKLRLLTILFVCLSLALMLSCSSNSTDPGGDGNGNGDNDITVDPSMMTMKINGNNWSSQFTTGSVFIANNVLLLVASSGVATNAVSLTINDASGITAKSYPMVSDANSGLSSYFVGVYAQAVSLDSTLQADPNENNPQGTLNITEIDFTEGYISGTFSMDLFGDDPNNTLIRMTEGQFNRISLSSGGGLPEKAKLDLQPNQQ